MYRNLVLIVLSLLVVCSFTQELPLCTESTLPPQAIWLESLDLKQAQQDWGTPQIGKSINTNPIRLNGVTYPHGLGAHAYSSLMIQLNKSAARFESVVGLDDEIKEYGSVTFEVWVDNQLKVRTDVFKPGSKPQFIQVDLKKAKLLTLMIKDGDDGINCDHADWAGARIYLTPGAVNKIKTIPIPMIQPPDIHFPVSDKPIIHGPKVVGTTPGHDFLFLIPATGKGPLTYTVQNLPEGLSLDSVTGIIKGTVKNAGTYQLQLKVSGPAGTNTRELTIIVGNHKLAQTPPMGWNAWNVWADTVNEAKIKSGADWMVKSGLTAHGYQYINIDDAWEKGRSTTGGITSNEKFPDMKALGDCIHQKGLKFGIYSSPGTKTCAGYEASYQHEFQDAKTFAEWGIDYLKYDWCSYSEIAKNNSLPELQSPYRLMHQALDQSGRDIVYSLCQYGMGSSWQWGESVGGNLWRTGEDISDNWGSLSRIGFSQNGREKYAGPGHWNDPDMMIVGKVGWGSQLRSSHLTANEQILHVSLWSLLAAPLLIGCDLSQMDKFTLDLLTNDEVIDIDQDVLGIQAHQIAQNGDQVILARPLANGTYAVGLFNKGLLPIKMTVNWSDIPLSGNQPVRDVWKHQNLGVFKSHYSTRVSGHSSVLLIVGKPDQGHKL